MEGYFELVVETLVDAGYRWYETANFCRPDRQARHNLGYWLGEDYLGIGIGAVSTVAGLRWRNRPSLAGYLGALAEGRRPPRDEEPLEPEVVLPRAADARPAPRRAGGARAAWTAPSTPTRSPAWSASGSPSAGTAGLALTRRGRFLGGGVTAELMAESPAKSTL